MVALSHKFGQLGNRLFAFAHLIGNAIENKYTLVNLSFEEYGAFFETTSQDVFCRYPAKASLLRGNRLRSLLFFLNRAVAKVLMVTGFSKSPWHIFVKADQPEYDFHLDRYYNLDSDEFSRCVRSRRIVFLFGRFFRDYDAIVRNQQLIRTYFRPIAVITQAVESFMARFERRSNTLVVGVHIRRGDYAQYVNGKYFYSPQQYRTSMKRLQDSHPDKNFCFAIVSNEPMNASEFEGLTVAIGGDDIVTDMYILAACDVIMGPPSTFSKWASFYGDKPLYQIHNIDERPHLGMFITLPPKLMFQF